MSQIKVSPDLGGMKTILQKMEDDEEAMILARKVSLFCIARATQERNKAKRRFNMFGNSMISDKRRCMDSKNKKEALNAMLMCARHCIASIQASHGLRGHDYHESEIRVERTTLGEKLGKEFFLYFRHLLEVKK